MPHHETATITGDVTDVFAHRFVVKTRDGTVLADLGPKGAEHVRLRIGDHVRLTGEMKPSELKVHVIAKGDEAPIDVDHPKKHHPPHDEHGEPADAVKTAEANGFTVVGQPRRKPKHFEVLGRDPAGDLVELHVELNGRLRHTRMVEKSDPKWATELRASR